MNAKQRSPVAPPPQRQRQALDNPILSAPLSSLSTDVCENSCLYASVLELGARFSLPKEEESKPMLTLGDSTSLSENLFPSVKPFLTRRKY
ncbi:hypothetical protein Y032_0032g2470 [Ancylostoma ceylanicum]|uniref:Uncharacterized protein n=1 Tax=Ancylostoma ceylanicum TaxID=53326 RepID=A0A016UNI4_9BILA|nr:hypothetical protein Y032_0032g2470 [Ancylostoma ceylanicum]